MPDITKGLRVDTLSINDQIAVTGGTADPRSTDQGSVTILPQGSLYISTTGAIYQKQSTSNLNWGKLVAEDFATGNVGIGTTAPTNALHIRGALNQNKSGIHLTNTVFPSLTWQIAAGLNGAFNDGLSFSDNSDIYMTIRGGNVGIGAGSISPLTPLHVKFGNGTTISSTLTGIVGIIQGTSNSNAGLAIVSQASQISFITFGGTTDVFRSKILHNDSTRALSFFTNNIEAMRIGSTGNVGIGNTSPGQKLDVLGNIAVTGTVDGVDLSAWLNQSVKTNADAIFNSAKLNRLLVQPSGSSVLPTSGNTVAILDNSGSSTNSAIFVLTSGISGLSRISLGDPTDANESFIEYDNSTQSMSFGSNAAERIRINSSGNVGISTVVPATPLHVKQSSLTAAIPVETLEQLDTNEPFIEVLGTENATTGSVLTGKTAHGGTQKFIKCKINGVVGYLQWSTVPI